MEMDSYKMVFFFTCSKAENVVMSLNEKRTPQFWRLYKKHIAHVNQSIFEYSIKENAGLKKEGIYVYLWLMADSHRLGETNTIL